MIFLLQFGSHSGFFVKFLIEKNVNISNERNFSDVYRNINYIGSLTKFTWGSFTLHAAQCRLHFDKHQKNEIYSLIKCPTAGQSCI